MRIRQLWSHDWEGTAGGFWTYIPAGILEGEMCLLFFQIEGGRGTGETDERLRKTVGGSKRPVLA